MDRSTDPSIESISTDPSIDASNEQTHHLSPITYYLSLTTYHLSPITSDPSIEASIEQTHAGTRDAKPQHVSV